jgi:hypothetical protein
MFQGGPRLSVLKRMKREIVRSEDERKDTCYTQMGVQ